MFVWDDLCHLFPSDVVDPPPLIFNQMDYLLSEVRVIDLKIELVTEMSET
ncbi:hypothetical protein HALDL1_00900 (plasmid) [Halobacterium sp. DL1]|jgi:hypothetical protein|nr:hypothetical protein HALDL1_00900 [Halobacterium sp. DL1]